MRYFSAVFDLIRLFWRSVIEFLLLWVLMHVSISLGIFRIVDLSSCERAVNTEKHLFIRAWNFIASWLHAAGKIINRNQPNMAIIVFLVVNLIFIF